MVSWSRPADQAEPREPVVERITASQSVVTVLHNAAGELCCTVVHFSHQIQPLPAGGGIHNWLIFLV